MSKEEKKSKIPNSYMNTKISPDQSQMTITKLLRDYGVEGIQWTEMSGQRTLKFAHKVTLKGVEKTIFFEFKPAYIAKKVKQWNQKLFKHETITVNHEAASMRLLFWYLESKLKAIAWGMETFEMEMVTHILVPLPDGSEVPLSEGLKQRLDQVALNELQPIAQPMKQLEAKQ